MITFEPWQIGLWLAEAVMLHNCCATKDEPVKADKKRKKNLICIQLRLDANLQNLIKV